MVRASAFFFSKACPFVAPTKRSYVNEAILSYSLVHERPPIINLPSFAPEW